MFRTVRFVILVALVAAVGVMVVQAGSVSYGGSVTDTSPCYHDWAGWYPYHAHEFTATADGDYTLSIGSYTWASSPYLYIVTVPFVDDNIEAYSVGAGYDPLTASLVSGQTYAAIVSPDSGANTEAECHTQTGDFTATIAGPEGFPEQAVEEPVPGCDVTINIPASAVGATLVTDAPIYWKPGEITEHVFTAGTTVRAIGLDESGAYYQVLYACDFLWVPVESLGPNYDAPWYGAPLPTVVVD